jgi:serine/threonine-protein kinase
VSIEPNGPRAYEFLARALAALDRPVDAVRSALEQEWRLLPPDRRASVELADRARLAMMQGDFAGAAASAAALHELVRDTRTEIEHAAPVLLLLDIYSETGDTARAGAVADEFRRERDAWIATRPLGDTSVNGALPRILATALRAGKMSPGQYETARADWLREAEASLSPRWRRELWVPAFAEPAETPEEARAALLALPAYAPLPSPRDLTMVDAAVGKVHALAGRTEDALPYLRRAAATCLLLDDPVARVRAQLALGEALEGTDAGAACAAYAGVIGRWGEAKPRSRTAEQAKRRAKAMGCKP